MTLLEHEAAARLEATDGDGGRPGAPARRRSRRPALHPGWLVVVACAAVLARATMRAGLNSDVFWHLAAGRWMLAHHSVIDRDVFSYTVRGRPWLADEWGFEVILAWMVAHLGAISYWLLSGGASILALVVSASRWRKLGATPLWVGVLSIPLSAALLIGLAPRPQDLSYLLFALELLLVTLARQRPALLGTLPLLFAFWANVHGSFLAGLALLALEAALALAARRDPRLSALGGPAASPKAPLLGVKRALRSRDALLALAGSALATLLNPHGPHLVAYAYKVATSSPLGTIEEWQSPDFHDPVILVAVAFPVLAAIFVLAAGRFRTELFDLLCWAAFLLATLHAIRFTPYLGIAFGGMAAPWNIARGEGIAKSVLTLPASIALGAALVVGPHPPAGEIQTAAAPVAAVNWLSHHHGRVFSTYLWNDYLIERGIPVFVDGRTDLYFGTEVLGTYEAVSTLASKPDPVLRRFDVRFVLWPAHSPLSNDLEVDPRWRLVRRFSNALVFEAGCSGSTARPSRGRSPSC